MLYDRCFPNSSPIFQEKLWTCWWHDLFHWYLSQGKQNRICIYMHREQIFCHLCKDQLMTQTRVTAFWYLIGSSDVTILTEKNCIYSLQYNNGCLATSDVFYMFITINQVLYIPLLWIKSTDVWKIWYIK